jgi:hypothetical protein
MGDTRKCPAKLVGRGADGHADTAPTGGALDDHRVADRLGRRERRVHVGKHIRSGKQRHVALGRDGPRGILAAERGDLPCGGSAPCDAEFVQTRDEVGVLTQEPIARMDGVGAGCERRVDDALRGQVTVGGGRLTDAHGMVRLQHVRA